MKVIRPSASAAAKATALLKKGGVVICQTDTVYGFLADATNKKAVDKIYKIKKRPKSKPLPVFVKDFKMARELAEIDGHQAKILKKLLKKVNRPLAQTSVNISTQEPLKNKEAILAAFGKNKLVGLIIDGGKAKNGKPSKII